MPKRSKRSKQKMEVENTNKTALLIGGVIAALALLLCIVSFLF